MRSLAAVLAILLVLLPSAPPATTLVSAHEDGIGHDLIFNGTVPPAGVLSRHLDFENGAPLLKGWVFMLVAKLRGGGLGATLGIGGSAVKDWDIPETTTLEKDRWVGTILLPEEGYYNLTLQNSGPAPVTYWIYFDQSCRCSGKVIPKDIPNGLVIFNNDTTGPTTVLAQFNEPRVMKVHVTAALLSDPRGLWPDDFRTLAVSKAPVGRQLEGQSSPVWLHELKFDVDQATRIYFFVEGVAFDSTNYTSDIDLLITPFFEHTSGASLLLWVAVGTAVTLGAVGGFLLWRGRRSPPQREPTKKSASRKGPAKKGAKGKKGGKGTTPHRGGARGGRGTRRSSGSRRRT